MFNKKRKFEKTEIKEINPKSNTELNFMHQKDLGKLNTVCPIVFTSDKLICNKQLIDLPFDMSRVLNTNIAKNEDQLLRPLEDESLHRLNANNINITIYECIEFVKRSAVTNISSALSSSEYADIFAYFPFYNYINECINNDHLINDLLISFFNFNSYTTRQMKDDISMKDTATYADNLSYQLAQAVCTDISIGADKAIDELFFGICTTEMFERKLICINKQLEILKNNSPENFKIHASIFVKSLVREIIKEVMIRAIGPSYSLMLTNIIFCNYYIYDDYLCYSAIGAYEQIKTNNYQEHHQPEDERFISLKNENLDNATTPIKIPKELADIIIASMENKK